jgi:hypothetical protein
MSVTVNHFLDSTIVSVLLRDGDARIVSCPDGHWTISRTSCSSAGIPKCRMGEEDER